MEGPEWDEFRRIALIVLLLVMALILLRVISVPYLT
jgi:hypothetical protein